MVGNHANGESAKHQLVSVTEAYNTVLQEAQAIDPILQTRRNDINNQVTSVHSRATAVEKMHDELQSQLDEMHRKASMKLKDLIQHKLNILLGDELELKRQVNDIERLEDFLNYQRTGDATQFLFSWSRHQNHRTALHDFKHFRDDIDVHLDLQVTGNIDVELDQNVLTHYNSPQKVITKSAPAPQRFVDDYEPRKATIPSYTAPNVTAQKPVQRGGLVTAREVLL